MAPANVVSSCSAICTPITITGTAKDEMVAKVARAKLFSDEQDPRARCGRKHA